MTHYYFELGEDAKLLSEEVGYNRANVGVSPSVPNKIEQNFRTDKPNTKSLTDITEFAIPVEKIYLSKLVDCFDGMLPCCSINTTPNSTLVNTMLDHAILQLMEKEHPGVSQSLCKPSN